MFTETLAECNTKFNFHRWGAQAQRKRKEKQEYPLDKRPHFAHL
jgi:hypothetical protein